MFCVILGRVCGILNYIFLFKYFDYGFYFDDGDFGDYYWGNCIVLMFGF